MQLHTSHKHTQIQKQSIPKRILQLRSLGKQINDYQNQHVLYKAFDNLIAKAYNLIKKYNTKLSLASGNTDFTITRDNQSKHRRWIN